ncbi:MAG: Hsp20 family protein [Alphaproteobacteria bacterium]|nr:MAG: Hsp20 family protein [Alphaproteobacteria bacterium]
MRYDWTPLWRSTVGFDRLFDAFDEVQKAAEDNYPLYNIERVDQDRFRISVARPFKRQFTLADHVEVKSASFENGLLVIELAREIPEAMKPRKIEIGATAPKTVSQIDARAA